PKQDSRSDRPDTQPKPRTTPNITPQKDEQSHNILYRSMDSQAKLDNVKRLTGRARNGQTFADLNDKDQQFALDFIQEALSQSDPKSVNLGNRLTKILNIPS